MKVIESARDGALSGAGCGPELALEILGLPDSELPALLAASLEVRRAGFMGVDLCSIINAKSGRCGQDCAFCAQSAHHKAEIQAYPLIDVETALRAAESARGLGCRCFSVVTSGAGPLSDELDRICKMVEGIARLGLRPCASVGMLSEYGIAQLRDAGLWRLHHNLESGKSRYPGICTTRQWEDNLATVASAKAAGLRACSGGIFGMGENNEQRVELAISLIEAEVDCVPINFLHPIPGTPLEGIDDLTPGECLRIIAAFRLMMPRTEIVICGGRERNLGGLQGMIFHAGATGLMIGNYLTTAGPDPAEDLAMIRELGLGLNS